MKGSVIFDLDGTLWDSTECAVEIWKSVLNIHGIENVRMDRETAAGLMGKTMKEIGTVLFPGLNDEESLLIIDDYEMREVAYLIRNGAYVYEGVRETLAELSKKNLLYIVSNCQDGYVQAFLSAHDMGSFFSDIEMSGRTGLDKAENIRLLMERNVIDHALYVGDTEADEVAAHSAGIPFIWAEYGFGSSVEPDAVISSIRELPECAAELLK